MKPIGLLGGTSWISTIDYYRQINLVANKKFGEGHSAEIILRSIDYHRLKQHYPDKWDKVAIELFTILKELDSYSPSSIIICNNTLHKAYDLIPGKEQLVSPVVHIIDCAIDQLVKNNLKRPLFLATKFTMEDDFYVGKLRKLGYDVIVPNESDRALIQGMQTKLSAGASPNQFHNDMIALCRRYDSCDSILLACTELPMIFKEMPLDIPVLDPSIRQIELAFECATSGVRD